MAPRKSTSRSVRPSHSGQSGPGEASSSKPQLNSLPGPDVASSITSGYEADDVERDGLNEVEREMFIHDVSNLSHYDRYQDYVQGRAKLICT